MSEAPRRGEVWLADLDKRRPVVVLTRDPMGRYLNAVIVAPVTSTVRGVSTEVELDAEDDIRRPSVANLDGVQLVPKQRLVRRVGKVRPSTMRKLCEALQAATACG